jgi:hypothetical protein
MVDWLLVIYLLVAVLDDGSFVVDGEDGAHEILFVFVDEQLDLGL